jgi:hypothetical protein
VSSNSIPPFPCGPPSPHPRGGGEGGAGHNTQFADYRAAGRFSAHRGETLLLFPPRHSKPFMASKRARGTAGDRQWVRGEGERATTLSSQTTGQRAGSVHIVEKLCSFFLLDIQNHSWRANGQEGPRGSAVVARPGDHRAQILSTAYSVIQSPPPLSNDVQMTQPGCEFDPWW